MKNQSRTSSVILQPHILGSMLQLFSILLYLALNSISVSYASTVDNSSIQAAIDAANPGDTIVVRSGLYQEAIVIDKAIALTAQTWDTDNPVNNTTIIDGGSASATIRIESGISGVVTIRGFVITHGDDGISAASSVLIEDNYFHTSNDLIDTEMGAEAIIRGNVFFDAGDDAIDIDDAIYNSRIENNRIYNSHDDGIEIRLQSASAPANPIHIAVVNNQIIGNNRTGIQFIDYNSNPQDTNRRFTIANNLFARNGIAAIGFMPNEETTENLSGADIIEPVMTYNNTFYNNNYALSGGDNHVVFNNIFVNEKVGTWRVAGEDSVVAYNLFYQNLDDSLDSTIGDGNIYNQDPQFQSLPDAGSDGLWDTTDDNYDGLILQSSSPAIDAGIPQYQTLSGALIPNPPISGFSGSAPDFGWKEFSGNSDTSSPMPTATMIATETAMPTATATRDSTQSQMAYYVDCSNGDDNNSGTSEAEAWRSLSKASSVTLDPNDALLLKRNCTWQDETLLLEDHGSSDKPILVSTYGTGELPQIINSTNNRYVVEVTGSYYIIENIHAIANPTSFATDCDNNPVGYIVGISFEPGSHDNIVQNSIAEGFYAGVAIDPDAYNNQVLNNDLINNNMMNPLDTSSGNDAGAFGVLVRGHHNEIAYNRISGSDACSYDYGRDGAAIEIYAAADNIIHHNYATESDVFSELGEPESANNSFYYNVFSSSLNESKFIVTRGTETSRGPVNNTTLYNNTVYLTGNEAEGFVCHAGCDSSILTMYNNIFYVPNNRIGYADAPFNEDYNLFWGGDAANITPGSHTLQADPAFVSAADGNFHLQADSVAINEGMDLGLATDFDDNSVPMGAAPDIGAYEYQENLQATATDTPMPSITPLPTDTPMPSITPLPTNTPMPTNTPIPTWTATTAPLSISAMFVSDLDASVTVRGNSKNWAATVTVTIRDEQWNPVTGATVSANWGGDINASVTGITDANGVVSFDSGNIKGAMVSLTVADVSYSGKVYRPTSNQDGDGDSNGTSIMSSHP